MYPVGSVLSGASAAVGSGVIDFTWDDGYRNSASCSWTFACESPTIEFLELDTEECCDRLALFGDFIPDMIDFMLKLMDLVLTMMDLKVRPSTGTPIPWSIRRPVPGCREACRRRSGSTQHGREIHRQLSSTVIQQEAGRDFDCGMSAVEARCSTSSM